jgi:hypothetical protein
MLDKLIKDEPLSPLLPTNETLVNMDDKSFKSALNEWTESAMKAPYVTVL